MDVSDKNVESKILRLCDLSNHFQFGSSDIERYRCESRHPVTAQGHRYYEVVEINTSANVLKIIPLESFGSELNGNTPVHLFYEQHAEDVVLGRRACKF